MKLEDAIYSCVHRFGLEELAIKLGMSKNTLQHKANPHDESHYFRPRELIAVQAFSRNYAIAHAMAAELGGQFIAPANFAHLSDEALLDLFTDLMAKVGDFSKDFRVAWADGSLSLKDFRELHDDLYQVKQVCAELEARLQMLIETRPKVASIERIRPGYGK